MKLADLLAIIDGKEEVNVIVKETSIYSWASCLFCNLDCDLLNSDILGVTSEDNMICIRTKEAL